METDELQRMVMRAISDSDDDLTQAQINHATIAAIDVCMRFSAQVADIRRIQLRKAEEKYAEDQQRSLPDTTRSNVAHDIACTIRRYIPKEAI